MYVIWICWWVESLYFGIRHHNTALDRGILLDCYWSILEIRPCHWLKRWKLLSLQITNTSHSLHSGIFLGFWLSFPILDQSLLFYLQVMASQRCSTQINRKVFQWLTFVKLSSSAEEGKSQKDLKNCPPK